VIVLWVVKDADRAKYVAVKKLKNHANQKKLKNPVNPVNPVNQDVKLFKTSIIKYNNFIYYYISC